MSGENSANDAATIEKNVTLFNTKSAKRLMEFPRFPGLIGFR